jgi:succinate dehydrogenase/fumarate reductase flavoprotein subunit
VTPVWDVVADLVVVGTGAAGLPAALAPQARESRIVVAAVDHNSAK